MKAVLRCSVLAFGLAACTREITLGLEDQVSSPDGGRGARGDGGNGASGDGGQSGNPCTQCQDGCYDLTSDPSHCGSCGNSCGSRLCFGGTCQACPPSETDCFGQCTLLQVDTDNCGSCGNSCDSWCDDGSCASGQSGVCPFTQCSGSCTQIFTDPQNCGSCGNACHNDQMCVSGACVSFPFLDGGVFSDAGGVFLDAGGVFLDAGSFSDAGFFFDSGF